jgi:hypothetical protein
MAIGYVKQDSLGNLVPETTAGFTPGTVEKIDYCCNHDYGVVIENGGCGCGYVGVSGGRPITYNPAFPSGTEYTYNEVTPVGTEDPTSEGWYEEDGSGGYQLTEDTTVDPNKTYYTRTSTPVLKGVLTVDCVCAGSVTGGDCAKYLEYNCTSNNNVAYNVPLWGNADTANGHREQYVSNTYPLTFNPVSGELHTKTLTVCNTELADNGITSSGNFNIHRSNGAASINVTCNNASICGECTELSVDNCNIMVTSITGDCRSRTLQSPTCRLYVADTECFVSCSEQLANSINLNVCDCCCQKEGIVCIGSLSTEICNSGNDSYTELYTSSSDISACVQRTLNGDPHNVEFNLYAQNIYGCVYDDCNEYLTTLNVDCDGVNYYHCDCTDNVERCNKICNTDGLMYTSTGSDVWTVAVPSVPTATWSIDNSWCVSYTEA